MSPVRSVTIEVPPETVRLLRQGGWTLYALHAVECTPAAVPVVWYRTPVFETITRLSWTAAAQAYLAPGARDPRVVIPTAAVDVRPGDRVAAGGPGAAAVCTGGAASGCIEVHNLSPSPLWTGLSRLPVGGRYSPTCALPLGPGARAVLRPAERLFLMIAGEVVYTGAVLPRSLGQGVLVDLARPAVPTLRYGVDEGWSWDGGGVRACPPCTELDALLILPAP
jgi:hypothetical protein